MHAALTALLALSLAAPTTPAVKPRPAAPARALAVIPLALTGGADDTLRAQLTAHLQGGLARGSFTIVDPAKVGEPGECSDRACITNLARTTGAGFVLRPTIRVDDRDYVVRLELYGAVDGALLAESEQRCDLCGFTEAGALVEAQSAVLSRKLDSLIQGAPRLSVATDPPGALVLVDNQLVGTTPAERTLIEGEHIVRVILDGYVGDERKVKLVAGVHETLELTLRREPRLTRFRQLGVAGVAIGSPIFVVGSVLLSLDGDDYKRRCSGPDVDREGDCRFTIDTAWGGALTMAAGAALIAAGAVLLLRTRDRPAPRRRVQLVPTGLGVVGRF